METWRKYNGALIPTSPPHIDIDSAGVETIIKKENAFFARWTSAFDCEEETEFWFVIQDKPMALTEYSKKTRYQIRRGLQNFNIHPITKDEVIENGYVAYYSAVKSYGKKSTLLNRHHPYKSENEFQLEIAQLDDRWEFWGIYHQEQLIGYSQNKIIGLYCDYSTINIDPIHLKLSASYALFYSMNQYYLNEKGFDYVNDGARSISHDTNIQAYLMQKFKFRKAFCKLHVVYHPRIRLLIKLMMPFGFLLKKLDFGLFKKLNTLILQENIVRSYDKQ